MKSNKSILAVLSIGFLGLSAVFPVYAERVCVHGHSGAFENPDRNTQTNRYGWGLQFSPKREWQGGEWVHYSIPVNADSSTHQSIRLRYKRGICTHVNRVEIWGGGQKANNFQEGVNYNDIDENSINYLTLDLGQPKRFWNSIGVSLQVMHDGNPDCGLVYGSSDHMMNIYSVCAFE